jgi:glycerol-1-phosphate dehydrogenase [NAD(P)+]
MIQNDLMDALRQSVDAGRGDAGAVGVLFRSLAITGFAMQYMKNSRPVSGAEHLFSHVWEMEDLSVNGVPVTHGHKVTIGTLAATAFTEIFFADPAGPPKSPVAWKRPGPEERRVEVSAAFEGNRACDRISATALEKLMDGKKAEIINQAFKDDWKVIRGRVLEKLLPYGKLKELLARAGCPLVPGTIGLSRTDVIATARRAQMIRNKYSILDLAWDMGVFQGVLSKLEESGEYLR